MDHARPIIAIVGLTLVAVIAFVKALRAWKSRRRVKNVQTSPIADLASGYVAVAGRVETTRQLLKSPLTGMACVYYRCWTRRDYFTASSTYIECESIPWSLRDDTGLIDVVPEHTKHDHYRYDDGFGEDSEESSSGVDSMKDTFKLLETSSVRSERKWKCRETIIAPGESMFAAGQVTVDDGCAHFGRDLILSTSRDAFLKRRWIAAMGWFALASIFLLAGATWGVYTWLNG